MKFISIYNLSIVGSVSAFYFHNKRFNTYCFSENEQKKEKIIDESSKLIKLNMVKYNCPGLSISVSVNGQKVWSTGFGLSDVENNIPCYPGTVMRIASISKSLTAVAIAELIEKGSLDIDLPVKNYVPGWPEKKFEGKSVIITTRQILTMLGGIRHYDKSCPEMKPKVQINKKNRKQSGDGDLKEFYMKKNFDSVTKSLDVFKDDDLCCLPGTKYLYSTYSYTLVSAVIEGVTKKKFSAVMNDLFKRTGMLSTYMDENMPVIYNRAKYYQMDSKGKLINAPYVDNSNKWAGGGILSTADDLCQIGTALLFSYQYEDIINTLTSKAKTSRQNFEEIQTNVIEYSNNQLNRNSTKYFKGNDISLLNRSILTLPSPFLKPETMKILWTPAENTKCAWDSNGGYALGWCAIPENSGKAFCGRTRSYFSHTGGAVGASSVLLILPCDNSKNILFHNKYYFNEIDILDTSKETCRKGAKFSTDTLDNGGKNIILNEELNNGKLNIMPSGVVVAILTNMQGVGLNSLALDIAKKFETL